MSTLLSKIVADFTTQLATAISTGGTTATLESITDDDGVTLPNGQYLLTIDGNNSQKEYWLCTLTGTSLTAIQNVSRQGVRTAGCIRDHRVGASVSITDFAHILYINNLLTGVTDLDENTPLKYAADPGITSSDVTSLATVQFVIDTALQSATDATNTDKGVTKLSVAAVSPTDPIAVGDNDTRVPTQSENDALAGTAGTPSSTNKYVTNDDTGTTGASNVIRAKANALIDDARLALTTAGDTLYSDGTDLQRLAIGSANTVYMTNSAGTAPNWSQPLLEKMVIDPELVIYGFSGWTSTNLSTTVSIATPVSSFSGDNATGDYGIIHTGSELNAALNFNFSSRLSVNTTTNAGYRWGLGVLVTTVDHTSASVRACFEVSGGAVYATTASGAAVTNTNITGSITVTNTNIYRIIRSGSTITFYVNGTVVATHTTTLPTSSANRLLFMCERNGVGGTDPNMSIWSNVVYRQSYT